MFSLCRSLVFFSFLVATYWLLRSILCYWNDVLFYIFVATWFLLRSVKSIWLSRSENLDLRASLFACTFSLLDSFSLIRNSCTWLLSSSHSWSFSSKLSIWDLSSSRVFTLPYILVVVVSYLRLGLIWNSLWICRLLSVIIFDCFNTIQVNFSFDLNCLYTLFSLLSLPFVAQHYIVNSFYLKEF